MFVGMGANSGGGYNLESSLRFRKSATAYLSRTPASAGNRTTFTYSFWTKRGYVGSGYMPLVSSGAASGAGDAITFYDDILRFWISGALSGDLVTTQVFRDPSAWYHIVVAVDTTQATASNRIKIYVNGSQVTSFSTATYPALNYNFTSFTTTTLQVIGYGYFNQGYDGYMTEFNLVDGQALTADDFGETDDTTGVWKPKEYTGTYGTNGFYLNFSDSTSTTTLGYDQSPNSNNWTLNNISLTAGTTYDLMNDVPTLTDEDTANYPIINPLDYTATNGSISDGNLTFTTNTTGSNNYQYTSMEIPTTGGKWYAEFTATRVNLSGVGYCAIALSGINSFLWWVYNSPYYQVRANGTYVTIPTINSGDIIQIAVDSDNGKAWYGVNNTWLLSGDPATGTAMSTPIVFTANDSIRVAIDGRTGSLSNIISANFGQRPFAYTPPTGFKKLNTYNLPDSTIKDGSEYFITNTFTGTGSTLSIDTGFSPDFVWLKSRSFADHPLIYDSIRGANKRLYSSLTNAESTATNQLNSFDSDGYTLGSDPSGQINVSGQTSVGWSWRGSDSSPISNTDGTITSTVSANTTSGFSIVTWTGSGNSSDTVGTGLSTPLSMAIIKRRDGISEWQVGHIGNQGSNFAYHLELNSTAANSGSSPYFMGNQSGLNGDRINLSSGALTNGATYVAYCFTEVEGFSKFGSYTGNGSADGPFIYTGFRPAFVIMKKTSNTSSWQINDTARDTYNETNKRLFAESSNAESGTYDKLDILSNGFKHRTSNDMNLSGQTYIYMAFASNPLKHSLAR